MRSHSLLQWLDDFWSPMGNSGFSFWGKLGNCPSLVTIKTKIHNEQRCPQEIWGTLRTEGWGQSKEVGKPTKEATSPHQGYASQTEAVGWEEGVTSPVMKGPWSLLTCVPCHGMEGSQGINAMTTCPFHWPCRKSQSKQTYKHQAIYVNFCGVKQVGRGRE